MRIFAEKGFAGANMREIAGAAGVDVSLISYQFGSKLGLWKAIVTDLGGHLFASLADAQNRTAGAGPEEKLRAGMRACIDFMLDHPVVPRFLLRDAGQDAEHSQWVYHALSRPFLLHFMPLMDAVQGEGRLRMAHSEMAVMHFSYGVAMLVARQARIAGMTASLADKETFRAALYDTLVEPVFHG